MKSNFLQYIFYSITMAAVTLFLCACSFTAVGRGEFDGLNRRVDKLETVVLGKQAPVAPTGKPSHLDSSTDPQAVRADVRRDGVTSAAQAKKNTRHMAPEAPIAQPAVINNGSMPQSSVGAVAVPLVNTGASSSGAPTLQKPASVHLNTAKNEAALYQQGQKYLKGKQYDKSAQIFNRMLNESPQGKLAPNARYWLGESYYARGRYKEAAQEFNRCALDYPQSEKAADSLLKLSYCHDRLGEGPEAMIVLDKLLKLYPSSNAAGLVRSGRSGFSN